MDYTAKKKQTRTVTTQPTATDQSQARETDINVIVGKFQITGRVPGATTAPIAGDFTNLPEDLRAMIEESRTIAKKRRSLPTTLREMPLEELLALTPDKLTAILTPPAPTPAPTPNGGTT